MLVYEYPFPKSGFKTTDISVLLVPTFLKIHASGAHANPTLHTSKSTIKIDKVRRSTITVAVPLHNDECHLTTVTTPWGRYKYWVASKGYWAHKHVRISSSSSRGFYVIVSHIPNKTKCVYDTLSWSGNFHDRFFPSGRMARYTWTPRRYTQSIETRIRPNSHWRFQACNTPKSQVPVLIQPRTSTNDHWRPKISTLLLTAPIGNSGAPAARNVGQLRATKPRACRPYYYFCTLVIVLFYAIMYYTIALPVSTMK